MRVVVVDGLSQLVQDWPEGLNVRKKYSTEVVSQKVLIQQSGYERGADRAGGACLCRSQIN